MAAPARCINKLRARILLKDTTLAIVNKFVQDNGSERYDIPPDFEFRGINIQIPTPAAMGFKRKKGKILMPFVKPCFGPMLVEVDARAGDFDSIIEKIGSAGSGVQAHFPPGSR
ncbi:MAG: DUF1894 domain-containing protein [Methanolinea sp.]|nr:DUF1894 domain-containing protein [Methanolinea sp.]